MDGGYIVTGTTNYIPHHGEWDNYLGDLCLLKIDPQGKIEWTRRYGGDQTDYGWCVQETNDGGYIVVGNTWKLGEYEHDIWLLKTDETGDTLTGISEEPPTLQEPTFEVVTPIGPQIVLRAPEGPQPLNLAVFDASGRLVDEIHLGPSSTVTWGEGYRPGVYFIRIEGDASATTYKVILIH